MTRHRRTARACLTGAGLVLTASLYAAHVMNPWMALAGAYPALLLAWCARGYYAAHHRAIAEADWERRLVLRERPAPLNPCCELADHSSGAAHDRRKCTDLSHRLTAPLTVDPRSAT